MRFILTLLLLTSIEVGSSQAYFNKQIGGLAHSFDLITSLTISADSSTVLLCGGNLQLYPYYNEYYWLTAIDTSGEVLWNKSFKLRENVFGSFYNLVKINSDFSILHAPAYVVNWQDTTENRQVFLVKIRNDNGDTVWIKEFGALNLHEGGYRMILSSEGQLALIGNFFPVDETKRSRLEFFKFDTLGNLLARKQYTSNSGHNHSSWSLAETADKGFILLGSSSYFGWFNGAITKENINSLILIKTDSLGNQQWIKRYDPWEWEEHIFYGVDIKVLPDGDFIVPAVKGYRDNDLTGYDYYGKYHFVRFKPDGSIRDSVSFGRMVNARIEHMLETSDGNFWAIGMERDSITTGQTGLIMKITPDLKLLWKREYRVSPPESLIHERFYNGIEMPDKGFILCGTAFGPLEDSTWQNGWVVRTDSLGCLEPGCDTLYTAIEEPPVGASEAGLRLAPNPTSGEVSVSLTDPETVLLGMKLLDFQGKVLRDVQFLRSARYRHFVLDLSAYPAGMYLVAVRTSSGWAVRKVVKI